MPGNFWDPDPPPPSGEDLTLRLTNVGLQPLADSPGSFRVMLETTRGNIFGVIHPVEGGTGAVITVGGAMGGVDGPADHLYGRLPALLAHANTTVLRLDYRMPNNFEECVLDTLAGCSFLQGIGALDLVLVGHSFGGAVAIRAGQLFPRVRGVAALSSQTHGTDEVGELGRPLLLVHGTGDTILSYLASEEIYRRAADPKRIVLYEEDDHLFTRSAADVGELLGEWIPARLQDEPMESGRDEIAVHEP